MFYDHPQGGAESWSGPFEWGPHTIRVLLWHEWCMHGEVCLHEVSWEWTTVERQGLRIKWRSKNDTSQKQIELAISVVALKKHTVCSFYYNWYYGLQRVQSTWLSEALTRDHNWKAKGNVTVELVRDTATQRLPRPGSELECHITYMWPAEHKPTIWRISPKMR